MAKFSAISRERLETCHPDLQRLFQEVVKHFDCLILEGHRDKTHQDLYYSQGKSKLKWPHGEHNKLPSMACDVMPYPVDFKNIKRLYMFVGFVLGTARQMGIKVRSGYDWDGDTDINDQQFHDGPHWELI